MPAVLRLEPRERRTVAWGSGVAAAGLVLAFVVLPFGRAMVAREEAIAAQRARVGRLQALVDHQGELQQAVGAREAELEAGGVRLVTGRTPALAAAALQALVQDYARMSRVSVARLDVAGDLDSTSTSYRFLPATLSATGDVYGLAQLLAYLRSGPRLLEVRELTVTSSSALRGDVLQLTMGIRSPWRDGGPE